ncbi:hypothetical protein [Xanthomonas sp. D-109]|uniref:hypothetical protein n=1 Tax=Xanthomonas sp. D-109 TaxID=2821274 RepID=UPI001ADCD670|nr:hypothetical protein [Xanthomonas sp. D-109]MBO9881221.1 hypothetical protein [Xanthomonas sp. D-109]
MSNHEEGLITQYVHQIQALGARAEAGEDVISAIDAVVKKAIEHFRTVKSSDSQANLSAFKGKLAITAEVAHSSQPALKRTLQHAAEICPAEI